MKRNAQLLFLTLLLFSSAYAQVWHSASEPLIKVSMNDLFFVSETEGFMAGDSGCVYHTTNSGASWEKQVTPVNKSIKKLFFLNSSYGWAGTGQGSVLITTNGGATWTESSFAALVPSISFSYLDAIYFTSQKEGFIAAGKDKAIYLFKTTDGGLSWSKKDSLTGTVSRRWYDMSFYGADKGVIIGDKKDIIKYSTNSGNSWTSATPIADNFFGILKAAKFLSPTEVIALGEGNEFNGLPTPVYKSTDGLNTWSKKNFTSQCFDRTKDVFFKNSKEAVAVGSNGFSKMFYAKTTDGGESWTPYSGYYSFGLQVVTGMNNSVYALGSDNHIIKSNDLGQSWQILPMKTTSSIYSIQFKGNRGYALSRSSDILVNEDGNGESWKYQASAGEWEAYSMAFINSNTGLVLKEHRHILKTTDGGQSWKTVLQPVAFNSRNKVGGITFADQNTGYAWMSLDDYGDYRIFKTTNAGDSWAAIDTISGPGYISGDIAFFDASTGVIAGPKRWMVRTSNGGASWDTVKINNVPSGVISKDFEDVIVIDNSHAWAISEKMILFSSDKGLNWNYVDHGLKNIDSAFYTISFYNDKLGYIGCFDGTIIKTTDGGKTWAVDLTYKDVHRFYSSGFNENGKIFFGTLNGVIITEGQSVGVTEKKNIRPVNFKLEQNFPNPFNPSTEIGFSLQQESNISLKIFDVIGREIRTLVNNQYYKPGYYSIRFDAEGLAGGVYYYQLSSGSNNIQTRKMIYLK